MKKTSSKIAIPLMLGFMVAAGNALCGETKLGRYTVISNSATFAQKNLLATEVKMAFPDQVQNLHQAFEQLLMPSGYRLSQERLDPDIDVLYEQPLPDVHRWIGPMTLYEALQTLAGDTWSLKVDPVDRTVSFSLKDEYRHYVEKQNPNFVAKTMQVKSDRDGWICPDKGYKVISESQIYFAPSSYYLNFKDKQLLSLLSDQAKKSELGIILKSYSDPNGVDLEAAQLMLSSKRGDAIEQFFANQGLSNSIVVNQSLGNTYPHPDYPAGRQRVSEIFLVKDLCKVKPLPPLPTWALDSSMSLEENILAWIKNSASWRNLVYNIKNQNGDKVTISFNTNSDFKGSLDEVLKQIVYKLHQRSEVKSLKATLYKGDKTIVLDGLVITGGEK